MDTPNQTKYQIPFNIMELQDLKESKDSIVVDMSKTNFPPTMNTTSTTFVYLRNIGFTNIKLDFSECDYETKAAYLKEYMITKFEVKQTELCSALASAMFKCLNIDTTLDTFFTPEEERKFVEENKEALHTIAVFLISLPLYLIMRAEFTEDAVLEIDCLSDDSDVMGANLYSFLEYVMNIDEISTFICCNPMEMSPRRFTKYFTKDNERLIYIMKDSMANTILYALATENTDLFNGINEAAEAVDNACTVGDDDGSESTNEQMD